jgi:hypothetical protein
MGQAAGSLNAGNWQIRLYQPQIDNNGKEKHEIDQKERRKAPHKETLRYL